MVDRDLMEQHFYLQDMTKIMDSNCLVQTHQEIMLDGRLQPLDRTI